MGLRWAAYLEVSKATVQVTPKCAHQWLAWNHMSPAAAAVGLWCALMSLPGCTLGRQQHPPGSGLCVRLQNHSIMD